MTPRIPHLLALSLSLLLGSCQFTSRRIAWAPAPGSDFKLRYSATTRVQAGASWESAPYVSSAEAVFSGKASVDPAKGEIALRLAADTLAFRADERDSAENAYMDGRLRSYRAGLFLSRTGQALSLEEEPALPPVAFSPLAIGRRLIYALPAFPETPLRQGKRWDVEQPLLDKFHPGSRVVKHYALSALRETPRGDLAVCLVEFEVWLDEDAGGGAGAPALKGSGKVVFNLDKGIPESASLVLEGRFRAAAPSGDSAQGAQAEAGDMELKENLEIAFAE